MLLEICTQSYQAAVNAASSGAHRIELCSHLGGGGITPSIGLITQVLKEIDIPVFVLIRPRPGDFNYSSSEIKIMLTDIKRCVDTGVHGIVSGCLNQENNLNIEVLQSLIDASQGLPFTFHRAFEYVRDSEQALNQLIDLGVNRILTGGTTGNAFQSRLELKQLQQLAGIKLLILAGSGVNPNNVEQLLLESQVKEVHSSAKYTDLTGASPFVDPFDSDPKIVEQLAAICNSFAD